MAYVTIVQDLYNEMEIDVNSVYRETDDFVGVYLRSMLHICFRW